MLQEALTGLTTLSILCAPITLLVLYHWGVWITSGQSQHITKQCLEKLQNLLPQHAFGGRGPKKGPHIFYD